MGAGRACRYRDGRERSGIDCQLADRPLPVRSGDARWFPVPAAALARAEQRFQRFGLPVLLLSWVPIIGDPITLVAGLLRVRPLPLLVIVTIAKGARYAVLAAIVLGVVRW